MSDAPKQILVTGDDQYGFGCVHEDFPIGTTAKYIRMEDYRLLEAERDALKESPAVRALADYQQADMDGVMVLVSRQAIEEVLALITPPQQEKTHGE